MGVLATIPTLLCFLQSTPDSWAAAPSGSGDVYQEDDRQVLTSTQKPALAPGLGFYASTTEEFWKKNSCSLLFSRKVPSIAKKIKNVEPVEIGSDDWFPICSATLIDGFRDKNPANTVEAEQAAVTAAYQQFHSLDQCVSGSDQAPEYFPPSQAIRNLRPRTEPEAAAYYKKIQDYQKSIADFCCADGSELCQANFKLATIEFCEAQSDPDAPDDCIDHGYHAFAFDADLNNPLKKNDLSNLRKKGFPLYPGGVVFTPFVYQEDPPRDQNNPAAIVHEWGHICSSIRRQIMVQKGSSFAYQDVKNAKHSYDKDGNPAIGCQLTGDAYATYESLFTELGIEGPVFDCLWHVAKRGGSTRFTNETCPAGCPRQHLEEGFAVLMSLYALPTDQLAGELSSMTGACGMLYRDNLHPLSPDVLACALKSKKFQTRVKEAIQCRK